jgi:hypothetical protein
MWRIARRVVASPVAQASGGLDQLGAELRVRHVDEHERALARAFPKG